MQSNVENAYKMLNECKRLGIPNLAIVRDLESDIDENDESESDLDGDENDHAAHKLAMIEYLKNHKS